MLHYITFSLTALTWHSAGVQYLFIEPIALLDTAYRWHHSI